MNGQNTNILFKLNEKTFESQVNIGFIYDNYITQIEKETKLNRKIIFGILALTMLLFMLGRFEIIVTYIITGYFPIKWGYESYKLKDDNFRKMWGTYSIVFFIFFMFDCMYSYVIIVLPLYFFIRTAVLLWMYLPCFKGAITLYDFVSIEGKRLLELMNDKTEEDKEIMLEEIKEKYKLKTE